MAPFESFSDTPKPFQNSYEEQHKSPSVPSSTLQQRIKTAEESVAGYPLNPKRSPIERIEMQANAIIDQTKKDFKHQVKTDKVLKHILIMRRKYPTYYDKVRSPKIVTMIAVNNLRINALAKRSKEARELLEEISQYDCAQRAAKNLMLQELLAYKGRNDEALRESPRNCN